MVLLGLQGCAPAPCTCIVKFPDPPPKGPCNAQAAQNDNASASADSVQVVHRSANAKLVWDGDTVGQSAKGWADCEKKPQCKASLLPEAGGGLNHSVGLKLRGDGAGWMGGGWNFFGWWPADAEVDTKSYKTLKFAIRIESKAAASAPDPKAFEIVLKCANAKSKCASKPANIAKYAEGNLFDGAWHSVKIPLAATVEAGVFDAKGISEIDFNTFSDTVKTFSIYVDDIAFDTE